MKTIAELMAPAPAVLTPEDSIEVAWRLMRERRVRHLPVCKGDKLVGLLSQKDLLFNAGNTSWLTLPVAEIMVFDVTTIDINASAREAAQIMMEKKISCLPVMDGDQLTGIVTDTDFLALVTLLDD